MAVNGTLTSLRFDSSGKQSYLSGLELNYGGVVEPGQPENPDAYETGFTATDANKNAYTTNSIFANANALSVVSNKSDGTYTTVQSGDYTYSILNAYDQAIDPTAKFPASGVYTLVVSYGSYIPQEITLNVGEYIYVTDVTASLTKTTYTTADIFSQYVAANLSANIDLSNGTTSSSLTYSELAENNLIVTLLTPKGITYNQNQPFGTAGNWTVSVSSTENPEIFYNILITVNAIPVTSITLDTTSKTLYPADQLQLIATVGPENATNSSVTWSSNNEAVATVDEEGLVTAVAVGGAIISATANDGTSIYGTCEITVVAKPADPEWAKVTDASSITIGDKIILAYEGGSTKVELNGFSTTSTVYGLPTNYTTKPAGQYVLDVVAGSSNETYGLKHGDNYLYWSTGNSLNVDDEISANASWSFSGTSTITNAADSNRLIKYNTNHTRFACYLSTSTSTDLSSITIWKQTNATPVAPVYPTAITLTGSSPITIGNTTQLEVGYTPSDTNVKNVTFTSSNDNIATVSTTGLVTGVAQGSATITATAEAANGTVSKTFSITVSPVSVTSVALDTNSASIKVGKTVTLVPTVYPTNATNKAVTWSSSATGVATVSNGVVTGVAAGTATITVRTSDGNKTATCVVTVTASTSGGEEEFSVTYTDIPTTYQTGSTVYTADSGLKFQAYNCANYSGKMQFKASSGYLQNTEDLELRSITINDRESNSLTVYGSNTAGSFSTEITGTDDVYDLVGYSYFKIARTASGAAYCSSITVLTGTPTPTDPTSIIMSPTSAEISVGGSKQLSVSYVPSNANQNKDVTWTSSNTNVATVSTSGLISVKSTASAGQTATITARLTNLTSIYATCTITVTAQKQDDHTVLIYICGADLESKSSLATGDIQEILKVNGQPDDVNIVIETGGASSWASTYGISSSKLERWHVENKSFVKDASLTYASMGLTSTLQSFIEYGLNTYPAERTGLILWNHGGGMHGVCYDEKKNDDSLLDNEVKSAVSGALNNCGKSGQKLEWIGYDACLMQVQDIAEMNSPYFNYMVASEESEAGEGWDYDNWVDDLYAKKTTPVILKAICDTFISDNGGVNSSSGDQTLSYLTLANAAAYKTAWEAMAAQLQSKLTSTNKSSFNSAIINNVKHFADSDYDYFCLFDAKDFINKLASASAFSSFRIDSSYTTAVINAHANLVTYSTAQKGAGNAYGLCMYWCNNSTYSDMSVYTTSHTNFTTWRSINNTYGTHK